jgi:hypothetical protein
MTNRRGKPKSWTDESLRELALETKFKFPNQKLTPTLLEKETGIGRNTWSRRIKNTIVELNKPVHIPELNNAGFITIPSVDTLFQKYGTNSFELKNELSKYLNLLSDLYNEAKDSEKLQIENTNLKVEIDRLKLELDLVQNQKEHYENLYNQIIGESYFPHLYDKSKTLMKLNKVSSINSLPSDTKKVLNLNNPSLSADSQVNLNKLKDLLNSND